VKNNIQAKTNESVAGAIKMIEQAMLKNPIVRSATYPDKIAKLMFNRYDEGHSPCCAGNTRAPFGCSRLDTKQSQK